MKKMVFSSSCVSFNLWNWKGVSWPTVSCMIVVSTLRKYLHETFSLKIENALPNLFILHFWKHKNFPLDISMLLTRIETRKYRTFSKIGAYEPWSADYLERFWFLLIKVGQGRGSWQKFVFLFRIWETVGQRMQYLGAHHRTISLSAAKSFWWKSKLCSQSSSSS